MDIAFVKSTLPRSGAAVVFVAGGSRDGRTWPVSRHGDRWTDRSSDEIRAFYGKAQEILSIPAPAGFDLILLNRARQARRDYPRHRRGLRRRGLCGAEGG